MRSLVIGMLGDQEFDLFNQLFAHHELCFLCYFLNRFLLLHLLNSLLLLLLAVKRSKPRKRIIERILKELRIDPILLHLL